jgi:AcrR family transcriptional regulator
MARAKTPRPRLSRAQKSLITEQALIFAAAEVIGEHGYAGASVARITERAGVAQGTFYLYFDSRQNLFDQLLPRIDEHALAFIARRIAGSGSLIEVEERGFRGYLDYLARHPWYARLVNETAAFSSHSFRRFWERHIANYVRVLKRAKAAGELAAYGEGELETLAKILLAMRSFLLDSKSGVFGDNPAADQSLADTYLKFLRGALAGAPPPPSTQDPVS